jgi:hypothetical protein
MKEGSRDLFNKVDDFLTEKLKGYDELKNVVTHGLPAHLANDLAKLRKERDKVLQRLGEQTFQLLAQGKLIVPGIVQATFRTAQEIVERITRIELDSEAAGPEAVAGTVEPGPAGESESSPKSVPAQARENAKPQRQESSRKVAKARVRSGGKPKKVAKGKKGGKSAKNKKGSKGKKGKKR